MEKHLHIDIETYSSIDIRKAGAYRYSQSVDFEILMVAFAFGDEEVQITDLARGENYTKRFLDALQDPGIIKYAHNANFERICLGAVGLPTEISQWRCSSVKAAYCGLPLSLANISQAMDLGDEGKSSDGLALIKFFSVPIRPTKANGGKHRNFPEDDPEKWEAFLEYCRQDVVAERAITRQLEKHELPEDEIDNYILDQEINDRGIGADLALALKAEELDQEHRNKLLGIMKDITGLDNPNSPIQLREWVGEAMKKEITSLAKDQIKLLIEEAESETVKKVLKLRTMTSRSSTAKYAAIRNSAGHDGRIRGLVQFYGANRTGRWAGRLVQVQNLPRNNMRDLDTARNVMIQKSYSEAVEAYPNVSDVLSQLIRTALVAKEGHTFAVADFSAIEARVLAWFAHEDWRLEVFRGHGKIYEASASAMFDVPIDEILPGSELRDLGKVAELALGYQGAVGALIQMGGERMGLEDNEMKRIVNLWRAKNKKIVSFWYDVNDAVIAAVRDGRTIVLHKYRGLTISRSPGLMTIKLPSGRELFYQEPTITISRFGKDAVKYKGMVQTTRKWDWIDSYGGKFVENIVQATARDLLASAMQKVDKKGFPIVMHVHDELVAEVPAENAQKDLDQICAIMSEEVAWAKDLPLGADGFVTEYYKKD